MNDNNNNELLLIRIFFLGGGLIKIVDLVRKVIVYLLTFKI